MFYTLNRTIRLLWSGVRFSTVDLYRIFCDFSILFDFVLLSIIYTTTKKQNQKLQTDVHLIEFIQTVFIWIRVWKHNFLTYIKLKIPRKVYFLLRNLRPIQSLSRVFVIPDYTNDYLYYNKASKLYPRRGGCFRITGQNQHTAFQSIMFLKSAVCISIFSNQPLE